MGNDNYMPNTSALADFSFHIATQTGSVSLQELMTDILFSAKWSPKNLTQQKISELAHIRQGTISDFVRQRTSITSYNWEKIVNTCRETIYFPAHVKMVKYVSNTQFVECYANLLISLGCTDIKDISERQSTSLNIKKVEANMDKFIDCMMLLIY